MTIILHTHTPSHTITSSHIIPWTRRGAAWAGQLAAWLPCADDSAGGAFASALTVCAAWASPGASVASRSHTHPFGSDVFIAPAPCTLSLYTLAAPLPPPPTPCHRAPLACTAPPLHDPACFSVCCMFPFAAMRWQPFCMLHVACPRPLQRALAGTWHLHTGGTSALVSRHHSHFESRCLRHTRPLQLGSRRCAARQGAAERRRRGEVQVLSSLLSSPSPSSMVGVAGCVQYICTAGATASAPFFGSCAPAPCRVV